MSNILLFFSIVFVFGKIVFAYNQCSSDSDCYSTFKQYCCKRKFSDNICASNCIGESCILDSDCASSECCTSNNICSSTCVSVSVGDALAGWIIAVIVVSIIVVIGIPTIIVICCCCCGAAAASSGRTRPGAVVLTQPTNTGMTVGEDVVKMKKECSNMKEEPLKKQQQIFLPE